DNGHTWSPINLPVNDAICVTIDKQDRIYIGTAAEGIFRSTDNGTNWSHIGLDSVNVNTIIVHSNGDIFAGTSDGVYVSTDNGGSWIPNNSGLSDTNIYSLLISQNGYIYAGTSGSGVFRSSIPITSIENVEVDIPLFFNLKQNYPNPFNPNTTIEFDVSHPSYLTLTIYNIKGEELETLMAKKLSAGKYKVQWQPRGLASGVYFYRQQTSDPSTGSGQRFEQKKKLLLLK
ncbi:MAG: T9SS type A sorting domain-containing protein, partial [bacterium]